MSTSSDIRASGQSRAVETLKRLEFDRERHSFLVATGLIALLVPLWAPFDFYLEAGLATGFVVLRAVVAIAAAAAMAFVWRSHSLRANRLVTASCVVLVGAMIDTMVPLVQHHAWYLIGLSIVFWGSGLIVWPARITALCHGAILLLLAAAHAKVPGDMPVPSIFGVVYLISTSLIVVAMAAVRERLASRALVASSDLEGKNQQLADALAALDRVQGSLAREEKLAALGRLLAQLSHEINNPLNVVHNSVAPLKANLDAMNRFLSAAGPMCATDRQLTEAWSASNIDFVRTDTAGIIDDLSTAVSRIRAVHSELRTFIRTGATVAVEGDFNAVVESTIAILRRGTARNVRLLTQLSSVPPLTFEPGAISQLVFNLVQNAIDSVGERGEIVVVSQPTDDGVELRVSDSGPGVSASAQQHMFEPFFTTKSPGQGTGLGLATCYEIAQRHQGVISLDDVHHQGASFIFRMPRRPVHSFATAVAGC